MNPNYNYGGIPSETFRVVVTDVAQQFSEAQRTSNGKHAIFATIECEDNDVRYCLGGSTPTFGTLGHLLASDSEVSRGVIRLNNPSQISSFSFINDAEQSAGVLQVTMEFEIGTDLT